MPSKPTESAMASPLEPPTQPYGRVRMHRVIIPSKSRHESRRATWHHLFQSGIPFTVVVEPQEADAYRAMLSALVTNATAPWSIHPVFDPREDHFQLPEEIEYDRKQGGKGRAASSSSSAQLPPPCELVVLPKNDQGVSYARNHILHHIAPARGWFWIMDDDISKFCRAAKTKSMPVSAGEMMRMVSERMAMSVHHRELGIFALDYQQFSFTYGDDNVCLNSYCNIAVCMNKTRMPADISYRLRVREDYDFVLQMMRGGYRTVRFRNLSFVVPSMMRKAGGMTPYYLKQKADIRLQNKLFLEAWGHIAAEVEKGTGPTHRFDIRVFWQRISEHVDENAEILGRPFKGFSQDPLSTTLVGASAMDVSEGALARAKTNNSVVKFVTAPNSRPVSSLAALAPARASSAPAPQVPEKRGRGRPPKSAAANLTQGIGQKRALESSARAEPARRPPQPAKAPSLQIGDRRYKGYELGKYRDVDPVTLATVGLHLAKCPRAGDEVVTVPCDLSQPVLSPGIVLEYNAASGTATVAPRRRGEPIQYSVIPFGVPDDVPGTVDRLEAYYV